MKISFRIDTGGICCSQKLGDGIHKKKMRDLLDPTTPGNNQRWTPGAVIHAIHTIYIKKKRDDGKLGCLKPKDRGARLLWTIERRGCLDCNFNPVTNNLTVNIKYYIFRILI